jgi:predicted nucleic-acid-binding protein
MMGLDTNVLVRYIVRDDPAQTPQADAVIRRLSAARPGFVSLVVLVELWWVLGRSFGRSGSERCALFAVLLDTDELMIESIDCARQALTKAEMGADFADALVTALATQAGCLITVTFDRRAAQRAGMRLVGDIIGAIPGAAAPPD